MPFDQAARAINEDWGPRYSGKHIQRYAEHVGEVAVKQGKRLLPPPRVKPAEYAHFWIARGGRGR
jgi:hypothetical protein